MCSNSSLRHTSLKKTFISLSFLTQNCPFFLLPSGRIKPSLRRGILQFHLNPNLLPPMQLFQLKLPPSPYLVDKAPIFDELQYDNIFTMFTSLDLYKLQQPTRSWLVQYLLVCHVANLTPGELWGRLGGVTVTCKESSPHWLSPHPARCFLSPVLNWPWKISKCISLTCTWWFTASNFPS